MYCKNSFFFLKWSLNTSLWCRESFSFNVKRIFLMLCNSPESNFGIIQYVLKNKPLLIVVSSRSSCKELHKWINERKIKRTKGSNNNNTQLSMTLQSTVYILWKNGMLFPLWINNTMVVVFNFLKVHVYLRKLRNDNY